MRFSRQEYWSGLPFPPPGDLPDPGIEPGSPALQADALLSEGFKYYIKTKEKSLKIVNKDEIIKAALELISEFLRTMMLWNRRKFDDDLVL